MSLRIRLDRRMHHVSAYFWRFSLVLPVLVFFGVFSEGVGIGQESSPGFWELQSKRVDAMLRPVPKNSHRYARLRQYFSDLHCEAALMEEQAIPKHTAKNLICVLPGKDTEQILVAARFEEREVQNDAAGGWSEAVMLPLLYNAMLAAHRQHTFVFAELCGIAGQNAFLDSVRKKRMPSPKAMVVLDRLGLSQPWFYTLEGVPLSARGRERAAMSKRMQSEAVFTARLQGISVSTNSPASEAEAENTLLFESDPIPSILIYSWFDKNVPAPAGAFRSDFEFLAYYLGRIDAKLAIPPIASKK